MITAYHGTSIANAIRIKTEGFRPGTYFAFSKGNASGPVVFTVEFFDDPRYWHGESDGWQFWTRGWVLSDSIKAIEIKQGTLLAHGGGGHGDPQGRGVREMGSRDNPG